MTAILTIIGFIVLYLFAHRMANLRRDDEFGFRPRKRSIWEKLFGKK